MKNLRKIMRKYYLRQVLACWLVFYMLIGIPASTVLANIGDGGYTVPVGTIGFSGGSGTDAYIDLLTSQTVINWQNFDTITGQLVEFGGVGSAVLNRIVAGGATQFYGNLQALGIDVFIINTRGFIQGPDSFMQARTLVLSGIDIRNSDFMSGHYQFEKFASTMENPFSNVIGKVETLGGSIIEAENIALIGKNVINRGILRTTAPGGCVVMAAGESVYLQNIGSNVVVEVDITTSPAAYRVDNGGSMGTGPGTIDAPDSRVVLAAGDIYSTAIEGVESLRAESYSNVTFTGAIQATGDVEIMAGVVDDPAPWPYGGSAYLEDVSAGEELSVVTNHGLTINGSADSGGDMTLKSDYDFWGGSDLAVTGTLTSGGDMEIEGLDITLGGDATAAGNMDIFAHGRYLDGELGDSDLTEGTDVWAKGDLIAGESINVTGNNLKFGHDVRANGGDLTLTARTAEDLVNGYGDDNGWGNIEVGSGGTLYARDNIEITNESGPDDMVLFGEDALTLIAETGTVKSASSNTSDADIYTSAYAASDADASVTIITGGDLEIDYDIEAEAFGDGVFDAIAAVTIDSGGSVTIESDSGSTTDITAKAQDGVNNYADVKIDAVGDVSVLAEDAGSRTAVEAVTMEGQTNTSNITINADGDLKVTATEGSRGDEEGAMISARASNEHYLGHEDVLEGLVNTATVDISARSVEVKGDNGTAFIEAVTKNEIWIIGGEADTSIITLMDIRNDSDIIITTTGDDDGDPETTDPAADNGDVLAIDIGGGGGIDTEAFNVIRYSGEYDVDLTVQGPVENTSNILINAGDDVAAMAFGSDDGDGDTEIDSEAWNDLDSKYYGYLTLIEEGPVTNSSGVDITAGDDVKVISENSSYAHIGGSAWNTSNVLPAEFPDTKENMASVVIDAGGDVKVIAIDGSEASIGAYTEFASNNTSSVAITTEDGDVLVHGINSDASIEASAMYASIDNTATIDIDAVGGDVKVIDVGEGGDNTSKIEAWTEIALNSNTSEITINATAVEVIEEVEPDVFETNIEGGNVLVKAVDGGNAEITAFAGTAGDEGDEGTSNTANVTIYTTAVEVIEELEPGVFESYMDGGDVDVIAKDGGAAKIQAVTLEGETNTSDVLICADGTVLVSDEGREADTATIKAVAHIGYINDASVRIGAREGVVVMASDYGSASIASKALFGDYSNTAETIICTTGGVYVIGEYDGEASIISEALYGDITDAYVGICAVDDVLVLAGINPDGLSGGDLPEGTGGTAMIRAEADAGLMMTAQQVVIPIPEPEPTTANARVTVVSHEGGVAVIDVTGDDMKRTAGIIAEAHNAYSNTASVGVAAYGNVMDMPAGVMVEGIGDDSDARILAYAHNGYENTADVVVCTPGEVWVTAEGDGSFAQIKSRAGAYWGGDDGATNTATTQVYASEVAVDVPTTMGGQGIWASAAGTGSLEDSPNVDTIFLMSEDGVLNWTEDNFDEPGDDSATLIIDTYDNVVDCPDCPPPPCPQCPEEEDEVIFAAVAPLPSEEFPVIEGCPALMQAAALELGIGSETIQVAIERGLAMNPNIQPCDTCANIVNYARVLQDVDGTRMAAMLQIFNEIAPVDAPFTPEMGTSIAMAFAGSINDDTMPQYATAMEYIDAFVGYVMALDEGLGSPVGDSVTFVMGKYGDAITSSDNPNIGTFISARLEQMGG